ncbi:MAG: hypothetical protein I3273_02410 [Candidatus Moeniiplasma glomeromycotorum]|nr:hypothetical protein [Candidatus Moeniiplasma glomeromycotorum]MCE8167030.1 hypothetical protein [Candidatus Moeniiplasma glomeromycotorum]MCE8168958.1 hypothetical protein [Candidatus Moeniiplasma glomeromycotorum]
MKPVEIEALASKIQLIIKEEEMPTYLETFSHLEKLLTSFKKLKISEKVKPMTRIDTGYLTLADLKKLSKKYTNQRIEEEVLKKNAEITNDHFILFKK